MASITVISGEQKREILLGQTTLLFTTEDFEDRESALSHYKKIGERSRQTRMD